MQFAATRVRPFFFDQRLRYHTNHTAAGLQAGVCHHAHQTVVSTAVNQLTLVLRNPQADLAGCFSKGRLDAWP
jgi:hypothetical protein